jgi:hypothetical protein
LVVAGYLGSLGVRVRNLAIGVFRDFHESDTVLLLCSLAGVAHLRQLLHSAPISPIAIHAHAEVARNHPVLLFAAPVASDTGFTWLVSADQLQNIDGLLCSLVSPRGGHQYFDIVGSKAQLMVSVNEYDAKWWAAYA